MASTETWIAWRAAAVIALQPTISYAAVVCAASQVERWDDGHARGN